MSSSRTRVGPVWDYLRVVWVLAAKDIVEAVRNKTTLTVLLGMSTMMLTVQALPLLLKLDDRPRLALYDAARTGVADEVRAEGSLRVAEVRHEADAVASARETSGNLLAVVLPAAWDTGDGPLVLDGYYVHWIGVGAAQAIAARVEDALTAVTGRQVTITAHELYPTPASVGHGLMVSLGLVLTVLLIPTILVPYLFLDEKTSHTLEVLHMSPASPAQVVMGKGLAGMVYAVVAAAVLLAFNLPLVVHWGLLVATVLAGALLAVGLGLLIGLVLENEGTVQMWVGGLAVLCMFPLMLTFGGAELPAWANAALEALPFTAMFGLFRAALAGAWESATVARDLALLVGGSVLVHAFVVWRLRRWEAA